MPVRIEDRCPACEYWLGYLDEEIGEKAWRSNEGFDCPNCQETIVVKQYIFWVNPISLIISVIALLAQSLCKLPVLIVCAPAKDYLDIIFIIGLAIFLITLCTQNLKLKNT